MEELYNIVRAKAGERVMKPRTDIDPHVARLLYEGEKSITAQRRAELIEQLKAAFPTTTRRTLRSAIVRVLRKRRQQ